MIGYLVPHGWGMDALITLTKPGKGWARSWSRCAVLLGMAALPCWCISLVVFRKRMRTSN
ncbi:hypothetical protein [Streptosporangium vulgare]|uniref:hypothetical protein n=1 Tax=Streptosporangium vulgare TaxID=46190 RepID=UPI0031DDD8E2